MIDRSRQFASVMSCLAKLTHPLAAILAEKADRGKREAQAGFVVQGLAWPARVQALPGAIDPSEPALVCVCLRHLRLREACKTADDADG